MSGGPKELLAVMTVGEWLLRLEGCFNGGAKTLSQNPTEISDDKAGIFYEIFFEKILRRPAIADFSEMIP